MVYKMRQNTILFFFFAFEIAYVMKDILLNNSCIFSERFRIEMAAEVFVDGSLHPNVYGKCLKISEAEERGTRGDLIANTEYLLQFRERIFVAFFGFDF